MAELLPCPFCGGEATLNRDNAIGRYFAFCMKCKVRQENRLSREDSVNAWNTRTPKERGGEK